jgi:hypothetical protein
MGQDHRVVGAVEVVLGAVPEVRAHDRYPAARLHHVKQLAEHGSDRVLVRQVLEEVRKEYAVEVILRQVGVHDVRDDHLHPGGLKVALPDEVDAPALGRRDRCDELAAARGRIQHTARRAHPAVQVTRDLLPHCLPAGLIDVAEPVLVQPLVVHANGQGCHYRRVPWDAVSHRGDYTNDSSANHQSSKELV